VPLRDTRSGDALLRDTPWEGEGESVDERDARDASERDRALSLRPCHGWSSRSPSHTCSALGVLGEHGVRGRVGL
jgi:hypothetical protein|tara:strand:- start:194 stop:418 length:225 start_codon:yes stop_codon:yes gene_type:complete